jgi:hypothetical protein
MATGVRVGEARVTASYQAPHGTLYATVPLLVLSPGTYRVNGQITDRGTGIPNVALTVLTGAGAGLMTVSRFDGTFALYGVGGRVRLHASRDGYHTKTEELEVTATVTHNFEMEADRQRTNLAGDYVLTVEMGPCDQRSAPVRSDMQHRRYNATVAQQGPKLTVTLSGADFIISDGLGNHFMGALDPIDNVTFKLGDRDDIYLSKYADLVERVDSTAAFLVYGTVSARATSTGIVGTLRGSFITADPNNPSYWSRSGWCYSDAHLFQMHRR